MQQSMHNYNFNVRSEEVRKMGHNQLAERCMPPSRDGEYLASIIRSNNNQKKLIDEEELDRLVKEPPTIGVVLSGGGWRSMEASTNFMDTLRLSGVLSHVSVVAGLSGGSWTCVLGAMSGGNNHLYGGQQQEWAVPPRYGDDGIVSDFDTLSRGDESTKIMLTTLKNMFSVDRAEEAAKAPGRGSVSSLFERFKDVLVSVGRLAAKVAYDEHLPHLMALLSANPTQAYLYNYSRILDSQFYGPLHTRVNREDAVFAQSDSEDLPLMVVAATSFARFPDPPKHKHDWFEFDAVTTFIDTPNNGMIQSQSVAGGGLRECTPMACRMVLPNLQIRYSQHGSQPFYKELTAPIIMAIGGCALDDSSRKLMKGVDKDCFTGHIFDCSEHFYQQQQQMLQSDIYDESSMSCAFDQHDPVEPRPVGQLYDAGISCNVPIHLANGRCNIAFVLDNSHNEKASEELAVAVCKGFYHIHVPGEKFRKHKHSTAPKVDEDEYSPPKPTNYYTHNNPSTKFDAENEKFEGLIEDHKLKNPAEAVFLQKHVHRWISKDPITNEDVESTNVVRIFLPKKGYSKAVWGPKSGPAERDDEPILIYLRGLRTESTFRMDRSPQEIKDNHAYMTKITAIGIKALEFIIKQPNVIPKAGYWTQDQILADYPLLRETVAQPLAPPRSLVNKVFSLLTILPPFKFVYNIVATQINKLNATTMSQLKIGRQLLSIGVLDNTRHRVVADSIGSSSAGTPTNATTTIPTLKSFHPAKLSASAINIVSESTTAPMSPMLRSGSTSIVAIPNPYRRTSSGNTTSQSILPSPYSPCASFRGAQPRQLTPQQLQQRINSPSLGKGGSGGSGGRSTRLSSSSSFISGGVKHRVVVPPSSSSPVPSPYSSSHRPPGSSAARGGGSGMYRTRSGGGGASPSGGGMYRAPSSPIMPGAGAHFPFTTTTPTATTTDSGAAPSSSSWVSGTKYTRTSSALIPAQQQQVHDDNHHSQPRAPTASPPRKTNKFTGAYINTSNSSSSAIVSPRPPGMNLQESVRQQQHHHQVPPPPASSSSAVTSPLLFSRNNTLDVRGSPNNPDDTANPKSILKDDGNDGYKNVANTYWNDPSFKMCVDALFWVLETLRAMKETEARYKRGRFDQTEATKIVIFPTNLHQNGDDELMQFKCLAASLLADEDLLDEFGHLTALLRTIIRAHRPKDLHVDAPYIHTKLDEIVDWANNYEAELIENVAEQKEMAEKRKKELREKLCDKMGKGFKELICNGKACPSSINPTTTKTNKNNHINPMSDNNGNNEGEDIEKNGEKNKEEKIVVNHQNEGRVQGGGIVRRSAAPTTFPPSLPPWITKMDASQFAPSGLSPTFVDHPEYSTDLPPLHPSPHHHPTPSPQQLQERKNWGEAQEGEEKADNNEEEKKWEVEEDEEEDDDDRIILPLQQHQHQQHMQSLDVHIAKLQTDLRDRVDVLESLQEELCQQQRRLANEEAQRLRASLESTYNSNSGGVGGGFASVCSDFNMDMDANASSSYSGPPRVARMQILPDDATPQDKINVRLEHIANLEAAFQNVNDEVSAVKAKTVHVGIINSNNSLNNSSNGNNNQQNQQLHQQVLLNMSTSSNAAPPRNTRSHTLTPPTLQDVEKLHHDLQRAQAYHEHLQHLLEQKIETKNNQNNTHHHGNGNGILNMTNVGKMQIDREQEIMRKKNRAAEAASRPPRVDGADEEDDRSSIRTSPSSCGDGHSSIITPTSSSASSSSTTTSVSSSDHEEALRRELHDQEEKVNLLHQHIKMVERQLMLQLSCNSNNNNNNNIPSHQDQQRRRSSSSHEDCYLPPRRQDSRVHFKDLDDDDVIDENEEDNSSNRKAATSSDGGGDVPTTNSSTTSTSSTQRTPSCNTTLGSSSEACINNSADRSSGERGEHYHPEVVRYCSGSSGASGGKPNLLQHTVVVQDLINVVDVSTPSPRDLLTTVPPQPPLEHQFPPHQQRLSTATSFSGSSYQGGGGTIAQQEVGNGNVNTNTYTPTRRGKKKGKKPVKRE